MACTTTKESSSNPVALVHFMQTEDKTELTRL